MNTDPATEFVSKITVTNRITLLSIIQKIYFEIHELFIKKLRVTEQDQKLTEIKREIEPTDFVSASQYFKNQIYKHDLFVPQHLNENDKERINKKVSISELKGKILKIQDNSKKEKLRMQLSNEYFNLDRVFEICDLVFNIKSIRNNNEHGFAESEISEAMLLHANVNRLIDLTPDHILTSIDQFEEYDAYLRKSSALFYRAYNPEDEETKEIPSNIPKPEFNYEQLKEIISTELGRQATSSQQYIEEFKNELVDIKKTISLQQLNRTAENNETDISFEAEETPSFSRKVIQPSEQKTESKKSSNESSKVISHVKGKMPPPKSLADDMAPPEPISPDAFLDLVKTRKSSKSVREELIVLRDKIYTIMSNTGELEYWDCILNKRIIRNIINNKIFTAEDFRLSDCKPGYNFITMAGGNFTERSKESKSLMDLQLEMFWSEVQEITKNHFFNFYYVFNNRGQPWAKNKTRKYVDEFIQTEPEIITTLTEYVGLDKSDIAWVHEFDEFSPAFLKAWYRIIKEFPKPRIVMPVPVDDGWALRIVNAENIDKYDADFVQAYLKVIDDSSPFSHEYIERLFGTTPSFLDKFKK